MEASLHGGDDVTITLPCDVITLPCRIFSGRGRAPVTHGFNGRTVITKSYDKKKCAKKLHLRRGDDEANALEAPDGSLPSAARAMPLLAPEALPADRADPVHVFVRSHGPARQRRAIFRLAT